jgi:hypothetical protein
MTEGNQSGAASGYIPGKREAGKKKGKDDHVLQRRRNAGNDPNGASHKQDHFKPGEPSALRQPGNSGKYSGLF